MVEPFAGLFDTSDFPARWNCGEWTLPHGWTHILSDFSIWGAYMAIPCVLIYFTRRRHDLPFPWLFGLFAAFILSCGTTHFVEAVIFWWPIYRVSAVAKAVTAVVSWIAVVALIRSAPLALTLKSPSQLEDEVDRRTNELQNSEEHLRAIVETAGDGIMSLNESGVIESVNAAFERMFGYESKDVVGKDFRKFISAQAAMLKTGETKLFGVGNELTGLRKDGRRFPVSLSLSKFRFNNQARYTAIVHDVSQTKKAEEALRQSELRLRLMLEQAPAILCTVDKNFRITLLNSSVATDLSGFGMTSQRFVGVSLLDCDPVLSFLPTDAFRKSLAGESVTVEVEWNDRTIEFRTEPLLDANKEIAGATAIGLDITDRKRAERALRRSEARLRSVINAAVDGIIIISEDGIIQSSNPACERLFGYSTSELRGRNVNILMPAPYKSEHDGYLHNYITTGKQKIIGIGREVVGRRKDGSTFPMYLSVSEAQLGNSRIFTGIIHDISAQKETEQELQKAIRTAEKATRAKSEFLANMSHEIRTPLSAIIGFAELLQKPGMSDDERRNAIETVRRNGEHLLTIVNDILDLSKIEAGELHIDRTAVSLVELLADVGSLLRPRALEKGIAFEIECDEATPQIIESDPTRLRQILINLLGNAIKFTDVGSVRLQVHLERIVPVNGEEAADQLIFEVIDTGIGMSPEAMEKIFAAFTQADETATRQYGGAGLGLTISQQLARALGGDITVKSQPMHGSVFRLELPAVSCEESAWQPTPSQAESEPQTADLTGKRLLIAEDHDANRDLLAFILRQVGAEVATVTNGQAAVETALKSLEVNRPFDAILMDIQMPVMDGYSSTKRLRKKGYKGPIIALTARAMRQDHLKCLESGCDAYLSKPLDTNRLLETLSRLTRRATSPVEPTFKSPTLPDLSSDPIDFAALVRRCMHDRIFAVEILGKYKERIHEDLEQLTASVEQGNAGAVEQYAHRIAGAAGNIAAARLRELVLKVEEASRSNDHLPSSDAVQSIRDEWSKCVERIEQLIADPGSSA